MPMPQSNAEAGHEHHSSHTPSASSASATPNAAIDIDSIVALAQKKGVRDGFAVTLPSGPEGVYTISAPTDNPLRQATLHVDQYSGKVLAGVRWHDYSLVPKATEMGIALREGKYFGLANPDPWRKGQSHQEEICDSVFACSYPFYSFRYLT